MKKLMQVSCDPQCGFMIKSHNKEEIVKAVKTHVSTQHNKKVTDSEIDSMIKQA